MPSPARTIRFAVEKVSTEDSGMESILELVERAERLVDDGKRLAQPSGDTWSDPGKIEEVFDCERPLARQRVLCGAEE